MFLGVNTQRNLSPSASQKNVGSTDTTASPQKNHQGHSQWSCRAVGAGCRALIVGRGVVSHDTIASNFGSVDQCRCNRHYCSKADESAGLVTVHMASTAGMSPEVSVTKPRIKRTVKSRTPISRHHSTSTLVA